MNRMRIAIALALTSTLAGVVAGDGQGRTGRIRPPGFVTCDRNHLTAFTGRVSELRREEKTTLLRMDTDDGTHESFTLRHAKGGAASLLYLGGERFKETDWALVATAKGVKPDARATVWVCQDEPNPKVDWERSQSQ